MKLKVYSGLSLSAQQIRRVLPEAICASPVQRNDVINDIASGVSVIAIIDGTFDQSMAVAPGEIMDALRSGLCVYGSSSMGALRAVELEPYGMVGVGEIFEMIKAEPYFRDDLLGQIFVEESNEVRSLPYVDFHFALDRLRRARRVSPRVARTLCALYRELHYTARSRAGIRHAAARGGRLTATVAAAVDAAFALRPHQKSRDAIALLSRIKQDLRLVARVNARVARRVAAAPLRRDFYPAPARGRGRSRARRA